MANKRALIVVLMLTLSACAGSPNKDGAELIRLKKIAIEKYNAKDYVTAKNLFAELVKKYPRDEDNWFRLGNCHARLRQPDAAIAAYRESLIRNPKNTKVWYNLAYIQASALGKTMSEMSQYVEPSDPDFQRIKQLTETVITPFNLMNDPQDGGTE